MSNNEKFVLKEHMIQFFNENAEFFNRPESEEKVFATIPYSTNADGTPQRDFTGLIPMEKIELPAMENPKYFFRFFRQEKLQMLFEACPESAAKLGTRPWKYILMYSPEFVEQCPCINSFSQDEKELILHRRTELEKYFR